MGNPDAEEVTLAMYISTNHEYAEPLYFFKQSVYVYVMTTLCLLSSYVNAQ